MKILILTQKVDKSDKGVLGFFHSWIEMFAKYADKVTTICLMKGEVDLPANTKTLSLGKEERVSRLKYLKNFYKYILQERKEYDTVFVHMNQEYVLLAGLYWRLMGKKVLLWRNHRKGNWLTSLAVTLSHKVFYTSPDSYTARFNKSLLMPVGVNIDKFLKAPSMARVPRSILSMGRISLVKNIDVLVQSLLLLDKRGIEFSSSIVGSPDVGHEDYYKNLLKNAKPLVDKNKLVFKDYVAGDRTPEMYLSHEVFVNLTATGSMDKTIFSAMVSGAITIVSNSYFRGVLPDRVVFEQNTVEDLASKIKGVLDLSPEEKSRISADMKSYVIENHTLDATIKKIIDNI